MSTTIPQPEPCPYCGGGSYHSGVCPRVKAIEYHPDGRLKRVEFHGSLHTIGICEVCGRSGCEGTHRAPSHLEINPFKPDQIGGTTWSPPEGWLVAT